MVERGVQDKVGGGFGRCSAEWCIGKLSQSLVCKLNFGSISVPSFYVLLFINPQRVIY